ncbi:MAG: hypothetical protein M1830_000096 [Pleopsidium flavum]|nr:MAG: hypothetical protein M1830_000096 [Pleopsidium flavum]
MPPQPQPPLWCNNTYLIVFLCALRLFTPSAVHTHDVRHIWEIITTEQPAWFEHMASLWAGDAQVAGVVDMLMGRELQGSVSVDGEEAEGWRGVRRAVDVLVGRSEGLW